MSARSSVRVGVITFPGSLDDRDAQRAIRVAGAEPVALWHGSHDLDGVDALVLPGGFSYGDYLRAGAIAALAPIMAEVKDAAAKGMPILGICNGFQMLVEAHLLPGGLIRNAHQQFIRRDQRLRVENTSTAWTTDFTDGQEIVIPLKNADGGYIASEAELDRLEGEGLVAFRYVGRQPERVAARHRRHRQRSRQRRRPDAPPRARGRAGLRPRHRERDAVGSGRPAVLHLRDRRRGRRRGLTCRGPRGRQTVPAGGQTPMMSAMTSRVTSSCAMFSTVSDDGRPSNTSWVMNRAAVKPAQRMAAVPSALSM